MKRFIAAVGLLAFAVVPAAAKDITIGLSWDARESALNQAWEDNMKAEAARLGAADGVNVKWVVNMANNDASRQAANIEDLINSGVNIIIARALDSAAIGASIQAAKDAKIPFLTFDRASSGMKPTAHVGGDSTDQAKVLGEEFEKILTANKVDAKCLEIQGSLIDVNAVNRTNEFKKLADANKNITIISRIPTEWNPELVLSGLTDAFRAHPEANCLLLASDWAIDAVQAAAEKFDKWHPEGDAKHVWIASNDLAGISAVKAMEAGYIDVSDTWDAAKQAKEAARVALAIAEGKDPGCGPDGCLVKGDVATPATIKGMTDYWARKYQ